jgi:acyl carrier protein
MDHAVLTQRVRELAADAICIDPSQIDDNTNLFEAGAQSLEFLDIVFKLEQEYGIEITRGEMEQAAQMGMSEEEFAPQGVISEAGLQRLQELMPEARDRIVPGLRTSQILSLFTIQTFVRIVERKLETV